MRLYKDFAALGLVCMAAFLPVSAQAMEFNVKFDKTIAELPGPVPPFVGSGIFGFNGPAPLYAANLPDGSYKFKDLTNITIDFEFQPTPFSVDPLYFYYFPDTPAPDTNVDLLYDPDSLEVVIGNSGTSFYFQGASSTSHGNLGSLTLNMKSSYIGYYPEFQYPIFLSFEPTNPVLDPGQPSPTAPYNRYGLYAKLASAPPGSNPQLIYNGIYGTVPGPLPLAGAAATFAWSRRLRRRQRELMQGQIKTSC